MIVCLLVVVSTRAKLGRAVIKWTVSHEAMLQGILSLLVPLVMSYHLFLLHNDLSQLINNMQTQQHTLQYDISMCG